MADLPVRVLCVDDQSDASSLMARHLSAQFDCTLAADASTALEICRRDGPFPVVVTDYVMPGMNGVELLQALRGDWPETIGVMVTALDDLDVAIAALHEGKVYRFVRKPWEQAELLRAVAEAADYHRLITSERTLREQLARTNAALDEKVRDLDEANELLEYWVEHSPAVLYSVSCDDGERRPSYISKNFHRLTGYERTAAIVDPAFWQNLVHPGDRERYDTVLAGLTGGDDLHAVVEYRVQHRDGNYVSVVDSVRAVHDGDGRTVELVGAWLDVSPRA